MNAPTPEVTSLDTILRKSGFQSLEPVQRPSYWGVDLDPSRRPGVPMMARHPRPLPNTRYPPTRQQGEPASPMHGRTNKTMPPVFGTSTPLHGASGAIRRFAYQFPDHYPRYWLLKLLGDRVDSFTYHAKKYAPFALPFTAAALIARARRARSE